MKLAAIDIGSNAVRLLIKEITITESGINFQKILLIRVPLRLGEDVFIVGKISKEKQSKLSDTMQAFRFLMKANDVKNFRACATSAMRESENGELVRDFIFKETKIYIDLISGEEEAKLIFSNWKTAGLSSEKTYLYIDAGGGSTEISLLKSGKRINSKSFKIGAVRMLETKVNEETWQEIEDFVKYLVKSEKKITAIGSGGNITKIFKLLEENPNETISYLEIEKMVNTLNSLSLGERTSKFNLKPNRADVIVPGGQIYLFVMKSAEINTMLVPKLGLSDGIINNLINKIG